jgi:TolA-binding protein
LNETFGSYTGEGGAIVASAGTYIAVCASTFALAANSQFMIHKPSTFIDGNETEIENQLKLLKNITSDYYKTYVRKLKKTEKEFKAKWDAGDFWLSATEALDWGFVSEVKADATTGAEFQLMEIQPNRLKIVASSDETDNDNKNKLRVKTLVTALIATFALEGVTSDSSETEVVAALQKKIKPLNDKVASLEAQITTQRDSAINALLDEAQKKGKIVAAGGKTTEQIRAIYFELGKTSGIDALSALLERVPTAEEKQPQSITSQIQNGKTGNDEHDWEWYQKNNPNALAEMERANPDEFKRLYKAKYGTIEI